MEAWAAALVRVASAWGQAAPGMVAEHAPPPTGPGEKHAAPVRAP